NQNGDAAWSVSLVLDFGVLHALEIAGSFLDCALDVFLWHRRGFCGIDGGPQPRVSVRITTADLGRHGDLSNQFGELRAALCIGSRFVMLDLFPLAMAGHDQLGGNVEDPGGALGRACGVAGVVPASSCMR